ncbi:DUF3040 domain-containing protein [Thermocrispum municipale]|jgi:hypothetical protein|uniref:DUF3040 domain-containing protein n=1 Tax=Thermocrispum municipale TaxID=37926 RepID=UPI0003FC2F5F|nr:DUF3040 domain-containing protein [Thermocrispum municipale]
MPLSEHEQRLLDEIEQALYAEDPKFASSVRGKRLGRPSRARKLQGALLFVVGMALLPLGVMMPVRLAEIPIVSVLGFLMMFFGALLVVMAFRGDGEGEPAGGKAGKGSPKQAKRSGFAQRMEERFRQRFEEDGR